MDRQAPRKRPEGNRAGVQSWRELLFLHWEVDAARVQALLPPGLSVDTFEGRTYVGLVPFTMEGIEMFGLPKVPTATSFHEVNVRVYVHHRGENPGVWFLSLDAASSLAVLGARVMYALPYYWADMHLHRIGDVIGYTSYRRLTDRPAHVRATWKPGRPLLPPEEGSLPFWLAERYFLYAERAGTIYRGAVHHVPYPLEEAELTGLEQTLVAAGGLSVSGPPLSVLASPGVDVEVFPIVPV